MFNNLQRDPLASNKNPAPSSLPSNISSNLSSTFPQRSRPSASSSPPLTSSTQPSTSPSQPSIPPYNIQLPSIQEKETSPFDYPPPLPLQPSTSFLQCSFPYRKRFQKSPLKTREVPKQEANRP